MKKLLLFISILLFPTLFFAQKSVPLATNDMLNTGNLKVLPNRIINGMDDEPIVEGSPYVDSTWQEGSLVFYPTKKGMNSSQDTITGFSLRYDVHKGEVDILHKKQIYAVTTDMIRAFRFREKIRVKEHFYMNIREFKGNTTALKGFVEVLSIGKIRLLKYYFTEMKVPDFNAALNTGSKNFRIKHQSDYYWTKGNVLYELKSTKINSLKTEVFKAKNKEIDDFMKKQNLNLKKEEDLTKLFDFYNGLKNE